MKRKVICISLLLITLLSSVLPVLAADDSVTIAESSVEADLLAAGFDAEAYKERFGSEARIITVREYGYQNSTTSYDLYLYAYIPELLAASLDESELIGPIYDITVENGNGGVYYTFKYVTSSECGDFFKFKLSGIKGTDYIKSGAREYSFCKNISIRYWMSDTQQDETTVYSISPLWFRCIGTDAKDTYSVDSNIQDLLTLNVTPVVYRTPTSDKGVHYQYDVFSVYFSVPNEYFEKYDYLKSIDITYREAMWNALVVSSDENKALADKFLGVTFSEGDFNSAYPSLYVNPFVTGGLVVCGTASAVMNNKSNFLFSGHIPMITNVFKVPDYRSDDLFISGKDVAEYLPYAEDAESYGANNVSVEFDKTFEIESFSSGNKSPELLKKLSKWFYGIHDEVALDGVEPIVSVDADFMKGYTTDMNKWCADHLIHIDDAEAFKSAYDTAKNNDETLVVLRFAVRDYYRAKAAIDTGYKWTNDTNSLYAQGTGFQNFRVINLNFMKNGDVYVVPVVHEAVDVNGGISALPDNIIDNAVEGAESWWKSLFEDQAEMFAGVMTMIRIIMLVLLVVILWQPVGIVVSLVSGSVKSRRDDDESDKK